MGNIGNGGNDSGDDNILHKGLVPAAQALELVLEDAKPVGVEIIPLEFANNRVLSADLKALRTQPPFAASAMDGYAVRHQDISTIPAVLTQIGETAAGHPFSGTLGKGQTVRIFTGAPVPHGADTIIIQENVEADEQKIKILQGADKGKFVRQAGLDFKKGETLLVKGTQIDPQAISLAASMNHSQIAVYKKPRVAILSTGDELVLPGEHQGEGQIIASNLFGIGAIVSNAGGEVINLGIARDSLQDLTGRIKPQLDQGADMIVTSGGASVGDHDLVKPALESLGFAFSFVKIAMRPGKPVIFGKAMINGKICRFLGLAGNPVSSLVSSHIYLRPLVQMLGGYRPETVRPVTAILSAPLRENDERQDYLRGTAKRMTDGTLQVAAFEQQDSSMLAILNRADCLIVRPVKAVAAKKGEPVPVILLGKI